MQYSKYDIGLYINEKLIANYLKLKLLEAPWHPESTYIFPAGGKRNLHFQSQWFSLHPWLVYSEHHRGALCKYCVLFSINTAGMGGHQQCRTFVTK